MCLKIRSLYLTMNNLSEELLTIIGKLHNVQNKKSALQTRIQTLEQKLSMTREASLNLTNEEQELVSNLQSHGIHYGQYLQHPQQVGMQQGQAPAMIPPEQLTSLLAQLLGQQYTAISPTSMGMNGMYGFPQAQNKSLIPQGAISPTSGVIFRN